MKAKKKVVRLSDTECVNCKHQYLCYSHQQWADNVQADDGECDNYQQVESDKYQRQYELPL